MAGIYIFLSSLTALLFIFTREASLRVAHGEEWVIDIGFTFLTLRLDDSDKASLTTGSKKSKKKNGLPWEFYRRLFTRLRHLLTVSDVNIARLSLPPAESEFSSLGKARLEWVASAALAYIESEARSLTAEDNAFILNSDSRALEFDITAKLKAYSLLRFAIAVLLDLIKFKLIKRKKRYVGK